VLRDRVLGLLCTRAAWAKPLLEAMAQKKVSPKDLRQSQALLVAQLGNSDLTSRLESVWGHVPGPGSPEKTRRIAEIRGLLPEGDKGNPDRGRPIFKENCAVCHRLFEDGERIGPELTGAERSNLDFLMTSLVDPSALIRKEYESQTVALDDGRILTGLIVEESANTLTLLDSNRQKTVVPRDQVEEMKPSPVSLMPEGLIDKLPENQIRDLFRYLQSPGPR
ncbi:PVC-type heme-binding CxxCH protein, partial [Singulisphaera rosea]